ncbi:MAG: acyl-ACP--UDP-N-acetylglucosamine O-acyltransferase [Calditrichaeota bacterium]|nr:MAG: acyl-ACP--UDP-N-acetylglucosamine O-acyltransferase [Calditrichota bacterium]
MVTIHPTAIVHPKAELGKDVEVGPYTIIESDVIIGDGCKIHSHVYIDSGTRLGTGVEIHKGAVLGTPPQDLKYKNEKTYLEVGDGTRIREFATLNRGTDYHYKTTVGQNCFIMAYVHIAHDCIIGNHVILSNAVNMAGHVEIEDHVGIGGLTAIHQFVKIGRHAFIGGGLRINKDVPPYVLAMGDPLRYGGVNRVGLLRKGFQEETLNKIKKAYRILYRSNLLTREALQKIQQEIPDCPEIEHIIEFVEKSERSIIRG